MGAPTKSLGGHIFGDLTVIFFAGREPNHGAALWRCWCARCKNMCTIRAQSLIHSGVKTCGCSSITHGLTRGGKPYEYKSWIQMKDRCHNPKSKPYQDYGGRGIFVCEEWRNDFARFLKDVGPRPKGTSIERIDNNKGYEPGNCKWATVKEQANNRRSSRLIHFDGKSMTLMQWSEHLGIGANTIWARLNRGWSIQKALSSRLTYL